MRHHVTSNIYLKCKLSIAYCQTFLSVVLALTCVSKVVSKRQRERCVECQCYVVDIRQSLIAVHKQSVFSQDVSNANGHHLMFPGNPVKSFSCTQRRQGSVSGQNHLTTTATSSK